MGGMGLEFAGYLASAVKACLVLVGRTLLPAREDWDNWLTNHAESDEVGSRILKIRAIEEAGGEVLIAQADVTDEEQMRGVLDEARQRFGDLNGVIHAAGVAGGGIIQIKTPAMAAKVLAPKVAGTRVLDRLLQDTKLDFFVMCSSRSSILGGFLKAIQISVKINKAGLPFTPQQLFQSQTVAELAAVLDPSQAQELTAAETAEANGLEDDAALMDLPLAGLSPHELEKIAMLLEETDRLVI